MELQRYCEQYGSVDGFLAMLHAIPGLGKVSRSTYYRWLVKPVSKTHMALAALKQREKGISVSVRVAVPQWLPIELAVELLTWSPLPHLGFGSATKLGLNVDIVPTASGGLAIEQLADGNVDIAFAAKSYESESPVVNTHDCRRVCTIVIAKLQALSINKVTNLRHLSNRAVGIPAESHLARPVRARYADSGLAGPLFEQGEEEFYAQGLNAQKLDAVIGFQPWLDLVKAATKRELHEVRDVDFGSLPFDIFVNLGSRNATGIRLFMRAMTQVLRDLHPVMDRRFMKDIADRFERSQVEIEDMMAASIYGLCNPDIESLMQLWEQDASHFGLSLQNALTSQERDHD